MRLDRERIYAELARKEWKVADLWRHAKPHKSDMSQATVWNAANGKRDTSAEVAQAIAAALGVNVDYLAGLSDTRDPNGVSPDMPPVTPEIAPLVRFLNTLPPEKRARYVESLLAMIDITYRLSPWPAYTLDDVADLSDAIEAIANSGITVEEARRLLAEAEYRAGVAVSDDERRPGRSQPRPRLVGNGIGRGRR